MLSLWHTTASGTKRSEALSRSQPVTAFGAGDGPVGVHHLQRVATASRRVLEALEPQPRHGSPGGPLQVQHPARVGPQLLELARLDAADFGVVRGDRRDRQLRVLAAQRIQVGRRAVEEEPADADAGGVAGDPLEPLGHARVDQQRGGALRLRRVDQAEDLLDLPHCVVLREQDLDVGRQPLGGRARVLAQERLVLLLGAREADDDALVHPHRAYTAHMTARPGPPPAMCDAPASKQRTIVRVTAAARLLEDPPGEAALARLRRCGFDEPERAARELRLVASHPPLGPALQKTMGSLLGSLARLPDALGALVRLERFARGDEALTLRKLLERGPRARQALLWALGGSPFLADS